MEKATCTGAAGERVFHGEGSATKGTKAEKGYMLTFSLSETTEGFKFESKLMKEGKEVEASGGPLVTSTEKIE